MLADWLRELFPRSPGDIRLEQGVVWAEGMPSGIWTLPTRRLRQGHVGSRKIRVVCKKCNETWIGAIDEAVKPILVPLIRGEMTELTPSNKQTLATWATKVTMVAEFSNPRLRAISADQLEWFWLNRRPPRGWNVWIAAYGGLKWRFSIYHHVVKFPSPKRSEERAGYNTQSTTIGLGYVLIHIISSNIEELSFELNDDSVSDLRTIWPTREAVLQWTPVRLLSDADVNYISDVLSRIGRIPSAWQR
jgi:hypothetical protein